MDLKYDCIANIAEQTTFKKKKKTMGLIHQPNTPIPLKS